MGDHKIKLDSVKFLVLIFCVGVGIAYCFNALRAPFWGAVDTDVLSNLLPVVQYRRSILVEKELPLYTELWYGGREQWKNPLWNFLYFPATLIWLIFGLKNGTSLVMCLHVIAILVAGWYLSGIFFKGQSFRCMLALLFASPVASSLRAGHVENIFAYPWVLLGIRALLDNNMQRLKKGCLAGICVGILALTGANYYVLYALILYVSIIAFHHDKIYLGIGFVAGALVGLPHIVSVLHLLGVPRGNPVVSISMYSETSFINLFDDLFLGLGVEQRWGYLALIGLGMFPMFCLSIFDLLDVSKLNSLRFAPFLAAGIFILLATGLAYQGHHVLDTFRVPARALSFVALSLLLFIFLSAENWSDKRRLFLRFMTFMSVVHVVLVLVRIRPMGSKWWLDNSGAEVLAVDLQERNARSVWIQSSNNDMLIHIALNIQGISIPNAYYGDMGQRITSMGQYCGFSFDYILLPSSCCSDVVALTSNVPARRVEGPREIDMRKFQYVRDFKVKNEDWSLYKVICEELVHEMRIFRPLQW